MRSPAHRAKYIAILGFAVAAAVGCGSESLDSGAESNPIPLGTGGSTTTRFDGGTTQSTPDGGLSPLCGHNVNCTSIPDDRNACRSFQGSTRFDAGHGSGASGSSGAFGSGGASGSGDANAGGYSGGGSAGSPADAGPDAPDAASDSSDASDVADASSHEGGGSSDASMDRNGPERDASTPNRDATGNDGFGAGGEPSVGPPVDMDAGPAFSCQVGAPPPQTGGDPIYQCRPAGTQKSGLPCLSSADCRAGLACAGRAKETVGLCLPYCCDSSTVCANAWIAGGGDANDEDAGSRLYCGDRALIDGASNAQRVPVCVRAEPCSLKDPYPCTDSSCTCPSGTACTIKVIPGDGGTAANGTTACDVPGKGRTGDRCTGTAGNACAAGYFCSESAGVCLKVCSTDGYGAPCSPGKCQATAGFPAGWGVCVGPSPAAK